MLLSVSAVSDIVMNIAPELKENRPFLSFFFFFFLFFWAGGGVIIFFAGD